jgi:hypothetical protein
VVWRVGTWCLLFQSHIISQVRNQHEADSKQSRQTFWLAMWHYILKNRTLHLTDCFICCWYRALTFLELRTVFETMSCEKSLDLPKFIKVFCLGVIFFNMYIMHCIPHPVFTPHQKFNLISFHSNHLFRSCPSLPERELPQEFCTIQ